MVKYFLTDAGCGMSYSIDGGATFSNSNFPIGTAPPGGDGDCTIAWGPSGNFYVGMLGKCLILAAVPLDLPRPRRQFQLRHARG